MSASYREWRLQALNARTQRPLDDDTGKVLVLTQGLPVKATVYSDEFGTVATQPLTLTGGAVRFWLDQSVAAIDYTLLTAAGQARFLRNIGTALASHHTYICPEDLEQTLMLPFGAETVETDTGFDLPQGCAIDPDRVLLKVTTADAGHTLDVGLLSTEVGGDTNGFVAAGVLTAAGYPTMNAKLGALLGATVATRVLRYVTDGVAKSLVYQGTATVTAAGYIALGYTLVP